MMVDKCPICGGALVIQKVEKLLKGGNDMAVLKVKAGVCHKCGDMVFDAKTAEKFEKVRARLRNGQKRGFELLGNAYAIK